MSEAASLDFGWHLLADAVMPAWASAYGEDGYGPWVLLEVPDDLGPPIVETLRWIPPGAFKMGSPPEEKGRRQSESQYTVTLTQGFWMMATPVRQRLWTAVMGANSSEKIGDDKPVDSVSWEDARGFLSLLNERLDGLELSLPSEAQWEYASRAGSEALRYGELGDIAWYNDNSGSSSHEGSQKDPNGWGLYDTLGNVWEWCEDRNGEYPSGLQINPEGSPIGNRRVRRGGGWRSGAPHVRAAHRGHDIPTGRYDNIGFRCVRVQG